MLVQNKLDLEFAIPDGESVFAFGAFTLDTGKAALCKNGVEIPLRPKTIDVLTYLVRNCRRLVSRHELMEAVWPDVIVTDDSLTQCLIEIRKALGDGQRKTIRTVPRRGYIFDLPVAVSAAARGGEIEPARVNRQWPSRWTLFALAALAIAIAATWWRAGYLPPDPLRRQAGTLPPDEVAIAVLPFTDLSKDGDQDYLADGISEEILNLLTRVPDLTVIARTSSFSIRDDDLDVVSIARRLNVTHILEGSVRVFDNRVRVTAHLVDGENGVDLWSQTFDNRLGDVFAMQTGIAHAVTSVLKSRLLTANPSVTPGADVMPPTTNLEAWGLYLRGKYFYARRSPGDISLAQRNFEEALALDQNLAAAWVGLAGALNLRGREDALPENEKLSFAAVLPLIRYAIGRALELDPHNPEALMRLATLEYVDGDIMSTLQLIQQAMQYGRNSGLVQGMLAGMALQTADMETAIRLQRRSVRLDPLNFSAISNLAYYLCMAGRIEESAAYLREAHEINPASKQSLHKELAASIAVLQQDYANAEALVRSLPAGATRDQLWSMLQYHAGNYAESDAALKRLSAADDIRSGVGMAFVYAFRGETDNAFHTLESIKTALGKIKDDNEAVLRFKELQNSKFLQALHADSRWAEWVAETGQLLYDPDFAGLGHLLERYALDGLPVTANSPG